MASYAPVATDDDGVELQDAATSTQAESTSPSHEAVVSAVEEDDEEEDYDYPTPPMRGDTMSGSVPLLPVPFGRHIGRMNVCWEQRLKGGRRKFFGVIGPCWLCTTFVTFPLIIFISLGAFMAFLNISSPLAWGSYALLAATCFGLFMTCTTDPGIVPRSSKAKGRGWRWNSAAQSFHAPGVTYDPEAQVLVKNVDHFCPWTGTIIADNNLFWFHWFVSALPILCIVVILVALLGTKSLADRERKCYINHQRFKGAICLNRTLGNFFHNQLPPTIANATTALVNATVNATVNAIINNTGT